jgi:hypothetical protein
LATASKAPAIHEPELTALADLKPHPRNYRRHPDYQQTHLQQSLREHGLYRNVVVAQDGTILAGHGVVEAAAAQGLTEVPVVRLPLAPDDPKALKLLVADNELARLAESDQELLASLLQSIDSGLDDLLGSGFDQASLSALLQLGTVDPQEAWAGMPAYDSEDKGGAFRTIVHFRTEEDAAAFFALISREQSATLWWPEHDGFVGESTTGKVRWEEEA